MKSTAEPSQIGNKIDKDTLKKEYLAKAKDSRDFIENKIKEIEQKISDLIKTVTLDNSVELEKRNELTDIKEKMADSKAILEIINENIEEKGHLLFIVEDKLKKANDDYLLLLKDKAALEEEIKIMKQDRIRSDEKINELNKKIEENSRLIQDQQADMGILDDKRKTITKLIDEASEKLKVEQEKLETISSDIVEKSKQFKAVEINLGLKQDEVNKYQQFIVEETAMLKEIANNHKLKVDELKDLTVQIDDKIRLIPSLNEKIEKAQV